MSILIMVFGTWGNNYRIGSGTHWVHCETLSEMPLISWSLSPYSGWWTTVMFWIPWSSCQFRATLSSSPWRVWLCSFCQSTVTLVKGCKSPLGKAWRKVNSIHFWHPLHLRDTESVTWLIWELTKAPRLCFYDSS